MKRGSNVKGLLKRVTFAIQCQNVIHMDIRQDSIPFWGLGGLDQTKSEETVSGPSGQKEFSLHGQLRCIDPGADISKDNGNFKAMPPAWRQFLCGCPERGKGFVKEWTACLNRGGRGTVGSHRVLQALACLAHIVGATNAAHLRPARQITVLSIQARVFARQAQAPSIARRTTSPTVSNCP